MEIEKEYNINKLLCLINDHKTTNDIKICFQLYEYIKENEINSIDELKKCENRNFFTEDLKQRNEILYFAYITDNTHLDKYDQNIYSKLNELNDKYLSLEDEGQKAITLIKIYNIIHWQLKYPYIAFCAIIKDEMN